MSYLKGTFTHENNNQTTTAEGDRQEKRKV